MTGTSPTNQTAAPAPEKPLQTVIPSLSSAVHTDLETPFRVRWREFRVRALPGVWFSTGLITVAALWPTSLHIGKPAASAVANREQISARWPAEQLASHPSAMTNSEGEFSLLRLQ